MTLPHRAVASFLVCAPAIAFVEFWQWMTGDDARLRFLFASPAGVWQKALEEYPHLPIWRDMGITTLEALGGLALGSVAGTGLALALWSYAPVRSIARPYITVLGAIPVFAVAPMLIVWFGIGIMAKAIMAALGVALIACVQTFEGMNTLSSQHVAHARMLGAGDAAIIRKILLPGAARWLLIALRINIGVAFLGAFIGEFISSQNGLGHYIVQAGQIYDTPGALFGLFNLSALALALDSLARRIHAGG